MSLRKKYSFKIAGTRAEVEAEAEGDARFIVRLLLPDKLSSPIRIGYLTGARRRWLAETYGVKHSSIPGTSARSACLALAKWACSQPNVVAFL